jgi:aspartate/methionine/tyrosine aminotransferase
VPGAPPPREMLERLGQAAAAADIAAYGAIRGEAELIDAYAADIGGHYGWVPGGDEIAITAGCNEAFVVAMMAVAKAGEAVLLPSPWYFNHEMTLRMLGIRCVPLPTHARRGFVPDPEEAAEILRADRARNPGSPVRCIVLVTPNNPTGAIYPAAVIAAFSKLASTHGSWLLLDETYRDFRAGAPSRPHALFENADSRRGLIQLYSFSKAYAIPGHRVGALVASSDAMAEIAKVLDCIQICAPRHAQRALTWAIPALADWRADTARQIARRAALFAEGLGAARGWTIEAIGAYFAYIRHPFLDQSGTDVARRLATEIGILALPGSYFGPGQAPFLRFAYANTSDEGAMAVGSRLAGLV